MSTAKGDGVRFIDGTNHPSAKNVEAAGAQGVIMYIGSPASALGKDATSAQYQDYVVAGLERMFVYELGVHDIGGLVGKGSSQLHGPIVVGRHPLDHGRVMREALDAWIPAHSPGLIRCAAALKEGRRLLHLVRIGGSRQYQGNQRIRIERNGCHELVKGRKGGAVGRRGRRLPVPIYCHWRRLDPNGLRRHAGGEQGKYRREHTKCGDRVSAHSGAVGQCQPRVVTFADRGRQGLP